MILGFLFLFGEKNPTRNPGGIKTVGGTSRGRGQGNSLGGGGEVVGEG